MTPPVALAQSLKTARNPYVGGLADRLVRSFPENTSRVESDRWALIEEMLHYAAEAEQRLAELGDRVAYLESLSVTDHLTGLANRRGLEEYLRSALAGARRHKEKGVIVFIDMDNFKEINDRFGHQAGDAVLQHVANILIENIRGSDFVARLGGDEFVVGLVRTDPKLGRDRAQKLQQMIESSSVEVEGAMLGLRASFGIIEFGPRSKTHDLLRRADQAMYKQKRTRSRLIHLKTAK